MRKPSGGNTYRIEGNVAIVNMRKTNGQMICDLEDWEKLKQHTWYETNGYIAAKINGKERKFHRCILDVPNGYEIDHINRKPNDNRKENLRIVTHTGNMANLSVRRNNKWGCKGIYACPNGYRAQININGTRKYLGSFRTLEEAISAREQAEREYQEPLLEKETLRNECFFNR